MPDSALNHMTVDREGFAGLIDTAASPGCAGIELRNDLPQPPFDGIEPAAAGALARDRALRPMLGDHGMVGPEDPPGRPARAQHLKAEAVAAIEDRDARGQVRPVHGSFHHALAGGGDPFPGHTGIVHISGVTDAQVPVEAMTDAMRGLAGPGDRPGLASRPPGPQSDAMTGAPATTRTRPGPPRTRNDP